MISEFFKYYYNQGTKPALYFWRDVQGHEIDCIIERSYQQVVPVEIKAGMTITPDFFKSIRDWDTIAGLTNKRAYVIYAGDKSYERAQAHVIAWDSVKQVVLALD